MLLSLGGAPVTDLLFACAWAANANIAASHNIHRTASHPCCDRSCDRTPLIFHFVRSMTAAVNARRSATKLCIASQTASEPLALRMLRLALFAAVGRRASPASCFSSSHVACWVNTALAFPQLSAIALAHTVAFQSPNVSSLREMNVIGACRACR